jgi:hypothetical protein
MEEVRIDVTYTELGEEPSLAAARPRSHKWARYHTFEGDWQAPGSRVQNRLAEAHNRERKV